jgi:GGDEF domain-containing protein
MFIGIGVFSAAGAVETLRGEMRENLNARVLTIVLSIQAAFYAARTVVFVLFGSESEVFQQWFDTEVSSYFTVALTITALVTTSVLRTDRARLRARPSSSSAVYSSEQVLLEDSFRRIFEDWVRRAEVRRDPVVVTAVALEDLDTIATAFGEAAVVDVIDTWVAGVRRHSPASALIGEDGLGRLMVVSAMPSVDDAKGQALRIFHGLLDDAGMGDTVIRPAIGIGIALSATTGYDAEALLAGARAAAARATLSLESSVVVAI